MYKGGPYSKAGMWDLEKTQIMRYKCAVKESLSQVIGDRVETKDFQFRGILEDTSDTQYANSYFSSRCGTVALASNEVHITRFEPLAYVMSSEHRTRGW
jgi:hypothetical protein